MVTSEHPEDMSGIMLGAFSDHVYVIMMPFLDDLEIMSRSSSDHPRVMMGIILWHDLEPSVT